MPYFESTEEAYKYLGGVFLAANDNEVGPKLTASGLHVQFYYDDPEAKLLVKLRSDKVEVEEGGDDEDADVKFYMPADLADKFWRGEFNLAVGLARGQVKAKGPVNKILKLVPLTKPLFPIYRDMVAEKDKAAA